MDKLKITFLGLVLLLIPFIHMAQSSKGNLPYDEIYAYGMDANVRPIFDLLKVQSVTEKDQKFIAEFQERFAGDSDNTEYESSGDLKIDQILAIFRSYWRKSLLDAESNYMMDLGKQMIPFLMQNYEKFSSPAQRDSLGNHLADYIRIRGFYTTEKINPTGRLVDLLIWRSQVDSVFNVKLSKTETIDVKVAMMDDFVTLGWMEYATLGAHHPGGWTTEDALHCVIKSYDMDSENFKVSYLAHEARHFKDKKIWPELSSADLEYRSKLTELSMAKESLFRLIEFFITNSNKESENGHPIANHYLIQNLSKEIFDENWVSDVSKWKKVKPKKVNKAAVQLLRDHTDALNKIGEEAVNYIAE